MDITENYSQLKSCTNNHQYVNTDPGLLKIIKRLQRPFARIILTLIDTHYAVYLEIVGAMFGKLILMTMLFVSLSSYFMAEGHPSPGDMCE